MSSFLGYEEGSQGPFSMDELSGRTGTSGGDVPSLSGGSSVSVDHGSIHAREPESVDGKSPPKLSPAPDNPGKATGAEGVGSPYHTDPTIKKAENSTVQPTGSAGSRDVAQESTQGGQGRD